MLVFGGNGLFGVSIVEKFLVGGFYVIIINRGNWYWDFGIKIKLCVYYVICDCLLFFKFCKEIVVLLKLMFDVVVDFSGYY